MLTNEPPRNLRRDEVTLRYHSRIEGNKYYQSLNVLNASLDGAFETKSHLYRPLGVRSRQIINKLNLVGSPQPRRMADFAPWRLRTLDLCLEGARERKDEPAAKLKHDIVHEGVSPVYTDDSKM